MNEVRKLKGLFDDLQIREHGIEKSVSGGSPLISDFESNAEDFLEAAEDAFELTQHANAVSDAKRAIYCQIDEVLDCLGYPWKRRAVAKKLDVIKRCGFAAPRILRRVNAARNLLEHEYVKPSPAKAEEALDIATLFVDATRRHLESFMGEFYVGSAEQRIDEFHFRRELVFVFEAKPKGFRISACKDASPERGPRTGTTIGTVSIDSKSILFPTLIRLTVAGDRESKITVAFHELFDLFRTKASS
jgi:hypothetical protein